MKKADCVWLCRCLCLGAVIALILWITLVSRTPGKYRYIMPLFWSYRAIARGNQKVLWEDIANILMFFPLGYLIPSLWRKKGPQVAAIALLLSLVIEVTQCMTLLGWFEVDDLFHNTLGGWLGCLAFQAVKRNGQSKPWYQSVAAVALFAILILSAICWAWRR